MEPPSSLITLLLFTAAALADGSDAPALKNEETIASFVDGAAARIIVRDLVALGPRIGGTPSGDRAAATVVTRLKSLGLEVEVLQDPPCAADSAQAWSVGLGDRRLTSAWPYRYSPPLSRTTAPLLLDSAAEMTRSELSDSVVPRRDKLRGAVVLTGRRGAEVHDLLAAAGAVAVLTDAPGEAGRYPDWAPIGSLESSLGRPVRVPIFALSYNDGRLLRESLERASAESTSDARRPPQVNLFLDSKISEERPRTVVGTLPGAGSAREEIVIVCAHGDSDSGGPGADDNASGVAALIETARALATASGRGLLPKTRPTLRFVVWGSEYHSSRAYVRSQAAQTRRFKAVFNFDEAGTGAERDALYFEGNDIPHNADLLRSMEAVAEDHAGKPGFWTTYTSVPALGGTDAYAFLPKSARGDGITEERIPSTTVFTAAWDVPTVVPQTPGWKSKGWPEEGPLFVDYSRYYHSSGDTPEHTTDVEPYNIERCAKMVAITILRMMRTPAAAPLERAPGPTQGDAPR